MFRGQIEKTAKATFRELIAEWFEKAVKKRDLVFVPKKKEDLKKLSHGVEKSKNLILKEEEVKK
jgi:hypothetical protein